MSVTFGIEYDPTTAVRLPEVPGIDAPEAEWDAYYEADEAASGPSVNVSNANAVHILEVLGLAPEDTDGLADFDPFNPPELFGQADAADFLGRVLMAQAINPADAGMPVQVSGGPGTGQAEMIDCGRREGYTESRLAELFTVAEAARELGRKVVWS